MHLFTIVLAFLSYEALQAPTVHQFIKDDINHTQVGYHATEGIVATNKGISEEVHSAIKKYFPENHETMLSIAKCESGLDPLSVGLNIKNKEVWSRDWGLFQINDYYHADELNKLKLNILDMEDNIKYASILYKKNGLQDWKASQHCWLKD